MVRVLSSWCRRWSRVFTCEALCWWVRRGPCFWQSSSLTTLSFMLAPNRPRAPLWSRYPSFQNIKKTFCCCQTVCSPEPGTWGCDCATASATGFHLCVALSSNPLAILRKHLVVSHCSAVAEAVLLGWKIIFFLIFLAVGAKWPLVQGIPGTFIEPILCARELGTKSSYPFSQSILTSFLVGMNSVLYYTHLYICPIFSAESLSLKVKACFNQIS